MQMVQTCNMRCTASQAEMYSLKAVQCLFSREVRFI